MYHSFVVINLRLAELYCVLCVRLLFQHCLFCPTQGLKSNQPCSLVPIHACKTSMQFASFAVCVRVGCSTVTVYVFCSLKNMLYK